MRTSGLDFSRRVHRCRSPHSRPNRARTVTSVLRLGSQAIAVLSILSVCGSTSYCPQCWNQVKPHCFEVKPNNNGVWVLRMVCAGLVHTSAKMLSLENFDCNIQCPLLGLALEKMRDSERCTKSLADLHCKIAPGTHHSLRSPGPTVSFPLN